MKTVLYGLLAETPIHPGAGQSSGFVDLPVAREAATGYPVIVGSSMKGALLDAARDRIRRKELEDFDIKFVFGEHDNAGALLVSDARLLLLPVRSLTSHFVWATCPHLVERYLRNRKRSGNPDAAFEFTAVVRDDAESPKYLGPDVGDLFLEERQFAHAGSPPQGLIAILQPLIRHPQTAARLDQQLVVLSDASFAWFARTAWRSMPATFSMRTRRPASTFGTRRPSRPIRSSTCCLPSGATAPWTRPKPCLPKTSRTSRLAATRRSATAGSW